VPPPAVLGLEPHRALDIRPVVELRHGLHGGVARRERRSPKTRGDGLGTRRRRHTQRTDADEQGNNGCSAVVRDMRGL
jgi:hypothetical protein